jgi:uncharacterized metal-binding protein YceD (DUF177 family)
MAPTSPFRVADLPTTRPTEFDLTPDLSARAALADELGLLALRKLRLVGRIEASGPRDWLLTGTLGATVVQACVVTLDPVTTRIDVPVRRLYCADLPEPDLDEVEMPDDDEVEPLRAVIDPEAVLAEALALALPLYPRRDGADLGDAIYAAPGVAPMTDEDARPFGALAALRAKLDDGS